jgi:Cu(I)/Ag(I) efflux system membrane protein CusA/SilA
VRQWQVEVSSLRLKQYGVSLEQVFEAIARNNLNVGGRTVEENGLEFVVRGRGLINSAGDLEVIALTVRDQAPDLPPRRRDRAGRRRQPPRRA